MPRALEYYQIGGFKSHTISWFGYDHNELARAIATPTSPFRNGNVVELIFGVRPSGASCLLMTSDQMRTWASNLDKRVLDRPQLATEFESLSPYHFYHYDDLVKTLSRYKAKYKKGKKTELDNSQANHAYLLAAPSGVSRGAFEQGRVFYRILKNQLDPRKFGLEDISWSQSIVMYSLAFNAWSKDERSRQERLKNPKVMDVGWTEVAVPALCPSNATLHFIPNENRFLGQGTEKLNFIHGDTEVLDPKALSSRLQDIFLPDLQRKNRPIILLVFGKDRTCYTLEKFGIDTSRWEYGIKSLLGFGNLKGSNSFASHRETDRRLSSSSYFASRRNRSLSPRQREHQSSISNRRRSPTRIYSGSPGRQGHSDVPVYIVDVQEMYCKLMQNNNQAGGIGDVAFRMGLSNGNVTGWCAGNECHQLLDIWLDMVQNPVIDDQRTLRMSATTDATEPAPISAAEQDVSEDPNDFEPMTASQCYDDAELEDDYDDDEDDDD